MLEIDGKQVTKNLPITHRIAEHQEEYITLPANIDKGVIAYAFKLKFKDILRLLFKKRIYFYQVTFGRQLQPIHANANEKDFEECRQYTVDELGAE